MASVAVPTMPCALMGKRNAAIPVKIAPPLAPSVPVRMPMGMLIANATGVAHFSRLTAFLL